MLESLFNKVTDQACNLIKKSLQHRCFPVKSATFLRTPILKNICEQILLLCETNSLAVAAVAYNLAEHIPYSHPRTFE